MSIDARGAADGLPSQNHDVPPGADGTDDGERGPVALLIGTYYMANPGLDLFNIASDDILSERRQRDIREVAERLCRFRPTALALEVRADREEDLNRAYTAYREGRLTLSRDEGHQLGFRIAEWLGLPRLAAIDSPVRRSKPDPIAYAYGHGQAATMQAILEYFERDTELLNSRLAASSILEMLRTINDESRLREEQRMYLQFARLGDAKKTPGADWLAMWYERNLRIFANLLRTANRPLERVLVLYGAGHIPLLTDFIRQSGAFHLDPPEMYLA